MCVQILLPASDFYATEPEPSTEPPEHLADHAAMVRFMARLVRK